MDKEYLTLNGKQYRVEATVRSLKEYCNAKGSNQLNALEDMTDISFDDVELLVYSCLKAGSKMDGTELDITRDELIDYMRPVHIQMFMEIYQRQSQITTEDLAKKKATMKRKWSLKRKKNKT